MLLLLAIMQLAPLAEPAVPLPIRCLSAASAARGDSLDHLMRQVMARYGVAGAVVGVERAGTIAAQRAYGLASVELKTPITTCQSFPLSSATKIFTGSVVMHLAELGRLHLDDSVGTYVSPLPVTWRSIRLRQLLSHLSGLPDVASLQNVTRDSALAIAGSQPLSFAPGSAWEYNQTNYLLLKMVVEKVTGESFESYLTHEMLQPLEMTHTTFGAMYDVIPGRVTSYEPGAGGTLRVRDFHFPEYLYTAAGLNSTVGDLFRWDRALLRGQVLRPATRDSMWAPALLNNGQAVHYGMGWDIGLRAGHRSAGHEGGGNVAFRRFIDDSVTVILLTNGSRLQFDTEDVLAQIAAIYAPATRAPAARLADQMAAAFDGADTVRAASLYRTFRQAAANRNISTEAALNALGYEQVHLLHLSAALFVFRLNTHDYPASSNAFDSLGEAYALAGDSAEAIAAYQRALQLNPGSRSIQAALVRLRGSPPND